MPTKHAPGSRSPGSPSCARLLVLLLLLAGPALVYGAPSAGAHATRHAGSDAPIFGVTVDSIRGLGSIVAAERALPDRPTTRVYMSIREPASYYAGAVSELDSVGAVMGELLDSSDARHIGVAAFDRRVRAYLSVLGHTVGIWEVGNEVNGNWTGPYSDGAAKLVEAYDDVATAGASSALTLYANEYGPNHCGDGDAELTPVQYTADYVPAAVRDGLTYVFESYYPTQCGGLFPSNTQVAAEMKQLHRLYPNALLGFGEVGLPHPARPRTLETAEAVMSWAYGLDPHVPSYVGGYFWWYAREDAFVAKAPLAGALVRAFDAEQVVLGPA